MISKLQTRKDRRLGIGVDVVEIGRLARFMQKSRSFATRTFSSNELAAAVAMPQRRREEYLAGRFAAKEATLKALGVGLTRDLRLVEIETVALPSGAPRLNLHGETSKFAISKGVRRLDVSISHEHGFAVAVVMLSSNTRRSGYVARSAAR
jgi:holo-[acyl-carrier protein] synthase